MDRGNLKKGLFVAFEGLDGCGKTTQAKLLQDYLYSRGIKFCPVREPGGTQVGNNIRTLLLDPQTRLTPWGEVLLYAAARAQLVEDVIVPALARGEVVVCDRYWFSSLAYQGYGLMQNLELIKQINLEAVKGVQPDLTMLLQVNPETGLARQRRNRQLDRIEQRNIDFYQRVAAGYQQIGQMFNITVLDGEAPAEFIHKQVVSEVLKYLEEGD